MPPVAVATPFRLFFLLAGLMAIVSVPAWVAVFRGQLRIASELGPIGWHAHEMMFGYVGAVLAGFLMTAAMAWTRRTTLIGWPLAGLVALWCGARAVGVVSTHLPAFVSPSVDALVLLIVAVAIGRPIVLARSWRNAAFPILLAIMAALDVAMHLAVGGHIDLSWWTRAPRLAADVVAIVIILFGGRVVPMFTNNAVAEMTVRSRSALDWAGLIGVWAFAASEAVAPGHVASSVVGIAAGVLNLCRLWGWAGSHTLRRPVLWVLHLGWLLTSLSLVARGVAGFTTAIPASAALHLLTVGGIGVFTIGMMARVSLGHSGRALVVSSGAAIGFALVAVATAVRVVPPIVAPLWFNTSLLVSAAAWAVAFALFTVRYVPIWLTPRADGKPG